MRLELDPPVQLHSIDAQDVLGAVGTLAPGGVGAPLTVPIDDVDENPQQPRTEFDAAALRELADSIATYGLLQAISVRPHPRDPLRWMLNFGARRLRACKLLGRQEIAVFVDAAADSYAQVIENEQRENLTALELALFIHSRMAEGESQAKIARKLAKSRTYVTFAMALIDAPDWLMEVYRQGRCRGMQELYTLRQLHRESPEAALELVKGSGAVTRSSLVATRSASLGASDRVADPSIGRGIRRVEKSQGVGVAPFPSGISRVDGHRNRNLAAGLPRVWAELDGVTVAVVVDEVPRKDGDFIVCAGDGTDRRAVPASRLRLLRIVEA